MDFSLSSETQQFVERAAVFARERVEPLAAEIDRTAAYPRALVSEAAARGLVGMTVPAEWGGAGCDYVTYALAVEAVASGSATVAVILAISNSLVAEPIVSAGTTEQRARWLGPLVSGQTLGAFAISEADAGSDANNQQTVAHRNGDGWVLTGKKTWVANAQHADLALVFARVEGVPSNRCITAFL